MSSSTPLRAPGEIGCSASGHRQSFRQYFSGFFSRLSASARSSV